MASRRRATHPASVTSRPASFALSSPQCAVLCSLTVSLPLFGHDRRTRILPEFTSARMDRQSAAPIFESSPAVTGRCTPVFKSLSWKTPEASSDSPTIRTRRAPSLPLRRMCD